MLIDSHCHLDRIDLKPYANDFSRMMNETKACGVAHMLCVSINLEAFLIMRNLVNEYPQVSISVGVHPNETLEQNIAIDTLLSLASDSKVIAIGETGLDYYRTADNLLSKQHQRFRTHIQAALSCNKPLIIHSRQAPQDTLQILQEEQASNVGGVLHCFTEDWDTAKAALDMNFYISFSGIVTFPNAAKLREVAKLVPVDRLLIETDSPYLAPVPHRGKSNEPKFVTHVAKCIAEVRNLSPESLITATGENFMRLFNISLNLQYVMWCILSIVTVINPLPSQAGWFATPEQEAAKFFSHKHYEQAAARFSDPYRKGVAYYRAGDFSAAVASFETVSRSEVMLDARYNLGNARFQLGDLTGAIAAYEAVLAANSQHEDAAYNLALARSMLPATAPTPEPELADKKQEQKQQDKQQNKQKSKDSKPEQQDKQEEKQQAGDSKQKQQEKQQSGDSKQKQQEKQQAGDSKQEQQEKQQAGDYKQEQQEKQQAGDSKKEQQEKQQAGDSKQNQENNSPGQNTDKTSQAGTEQDQNQQSGAESNQEQTGNSPSKQTSDNQDTAEQSSPEQQEQGAAKEPKQDAEKKGEKGNKEQQDQSSGTKSQEQQEQGQGKEKSLQKQQDGTQPDNNKDEGEGGNKPQFETEGKNKLEPETKGDSDSNQDKLQQESESKQRAKPDTNSGNQPQPDQAGTAEQSPPSEQKEGSGGQNKENSQSSQRGQRPPNNRNDLPPDLPPEGQDMTAVPLHQLDQVGQAPGNNEPGDDGTSALGGNPAAGPGMAILEQMLEQVEGDPAYLMRNAFLLEEAKYKRSRGGVAVEIRPW